METILALDFGTQGAKGMVLDSAGGCIVSASQSYGFCVNHGGMMEQSPESWWAACLKICRELATQSPQAYHAISGIGLSAQMHGVVLLGRDGQPIGTCITWCDTRCTEQALQLKELFPYQLKARLQNPFVSAYTSPKLLWVKNHLPQELANAEKILFCKDYIRYLLCGTLFTDYSDASASLLYDFERHCWDREAIDLLGIPHDLLPEILPSASVAGTLTPKSASLLGLASGIPVAVGAGDLACSILGAGLSGSGQALINLGTAGQVLSLEDGINSPKEGRYRFAFCDEDTTFSLFALPSAAYCLRWFSEQVSYVDAYAAQTGIDPFVFMDTLAATSPPGARGLIFAPYLNGTGSPYFNDLVRAAFIRLDAGHSKSDMIRAILEGVCYGVRDCLKAANGTESQVFFSGGGSKSVLWRSMMADILECKITCPISKEASCVGAGLLAATAIGIYPHYSQAAKNLPIGEYIPPNSDLFGVYRKSYATYQKLYPLLAQL